MTLTPEAEQQISSIVGSGQVVLFMKGNRDSPQCGFSAQVVQILDRVLPSYTTFDVLSDTEVREGIKTFSDWPTIPQLYIGGEFQGGCDIIKEMYQGGDLHQALGIERPATTSVEVEVTAGAKELLLDAQSRSGGGDLHVAIDAQFRHSFGFGPPGGDELVVDSEGLTLLFDHDSAARASGLVIDVESSEAGTRLRIDNPNQPVSG